MLDGIIDDSNASVTSRTMIARMKEEEVKDSSLSWSEEEHWSAGLSSISVL